MSQPRTALAAINAFDQDDFVALLGFVFENSPWIAAQAWYARPFRDRAQLHQALVAVVTATARDEQVALIRAHPDLAGKLARAGQLTRESAGEQAAAGLDSLTPEEVEAFTQQNAAYRAKFDFPFVICARLNQKDTILASFADRLHNSRDEEIRTALAEIAKIAALRLESVVADEPA